MNLKELRYLRETLLSFQDVVSHHCNGDETGLYLEMMDDYGKSMEIIKKNVMKIHARNAIVRLKRK